MPVAVLNGEHAGTAAAVIAGDGEFCVNVPRTVPLFVTFCPATTLPVTRLDGLRLTGPCVETRSPCKLPSSPIEPLLATLAALPLLPEPYGPSDESKLSISPFFPETVTLFRPTIPLRKTVS